MKVLTKRAFVPKPSAEKSEPTQIKQKPSAKEIERKIQRLSADAPVLDCQAILSDLRG